MMKIRNTIKYIGTLCVLPYIASCSFTADVTSIIDKSINGSGSRIELVKNGIANSDREDAAVLRIYALTSEGASVQGFTPSLKIIGDGTNISECGPISGGYAECTVISDAAGEKIVTVDNLPIEKSAQALFSEPSSNIQVTKLNDNALANGTDSITFEFLIKNSSGQLKTGVHPHGQLVGTQKGIVNCTPSNSEGKAFCRIRSFEAGSFRLSSSLLTETPLTFSFLEPKVKAVNPRVDKDEEAIIKVKVPNGETPVLRSIPDPDPDFTQTCQPPVNGYATCTVSSGSVGTKVIEVISPAGINDKIEIVFADPANSVRPSPNNPEKIKADDSSPYEFIVDVGAGNVGVVPVIDVIGSGDNQVSCQPSVNGKSVCQLTSNAPGEKEIIVKSPPTKESIKVTFEAASIIKDNPSLADGISPVKIYVPMAMAVGEKAEISVSQIPDGAETKVACAPAVMSDEMGIAQSLCLVTADTTGEYKVTVASLKAEVLDISFADVKSSFKFESAATSTAVAGASDETGKVKVVVNLKNHFGAPRSGETPQLKVTGSGAHNAICNPTDVLGNAICTITNSVSGVKYISVVSPLIKGQLVAQFTVANVGFDHNLSVIEAVTHPKSFAVLPLQMGSSLSGQVPVLTASGPGNVTSFCEPANDSGRAVCYVQGDQVGNVSVGIAEPASPDSIIVKLESNVRSCVDLITNATVAKKLWEGQLNNEFNKWGPCVVHSCATNYENRTTSCEAAVRECSPKPDGSALTKQTWNSSNDQTWGLCTIESCKTNYTISGAGPNNKCEPDTVSCAGKVALPANASAGLTKWSGTAWGACQATACNYPYKVASGACAAADATPDTPFLFINLSDVGLSSVITSNEIKITGIEIPVPVTITGGIDARIESSLGPSTWVDRGTSYDGLQNDEWVRIVTTSANKVVTPTVVGIKIGEAALHNWTVTTVNRLSPSNPILTHSANQKTFTVAWGSGGAGNGNCTLQYRKDGSEWTALVGFSQNCDAALSSTEVTLPMDEMNGWTNNFASGVDVRLVMAEGGGQVLTFTEKLTCSSMTPLPLNDANGTVDANCNGKWSDDFDDVAPTGGSFSIAATDTVTGGSDTLTASRNINLVINCPTDQAGYVTYAASDTNSAPVPGSFAACESVGATKAFTLSSGDGLKTVYMWFKDGNGNVTSSSVSDTITLDQTGPGGSFTVPALTNTEAINLTVTCPAEANVEIAYGLAANGADWTAWTACTGTVPLTLTGTDGTKPIYMGFRDALGNISNASQTTILDKTAPAGGSFVIAEDTMTKNTSVNLTITCATDTNGPVQVAYGDNASPSNWEACAAKTWTLTGADGSKTLYARFKDAAGNISSSSSKTITLDTTAPVSGAVGNSDVDQTSLTIAVTVNAGNDGAGVGLSMTDSDFALEVASATLTGTNCGTFGAYEDAGVNETAGATSYSYTATASKCYMFQYKVKDKVGNQATFAGSKITKVFLPANMTASATSITGMDVVGPGNPKYGDEKTITFTNSGGVAATLGATALTLSNITNFEIVAGSTTCTDNLSVAPGASCDVVVKPKATANGELKGNLTLDWSSSL